MRPIVVLETVRKYAFAVSSPCSITTCLVRNISLALDLCRKPPSLSVLEIERIFFGLLRVRIFVGKPTGMRQPTVIL